MITKLLIIILHVCIPLVGTTPSTGDQSLFERSLDATEGLLEFFSADYSSINVDGLFGLRVGEGQLLDAIDVCEKKPTCPFSILSRLTALAVKLGTTCERALPYVEQADPAYYERFMQTIDAPYRLPYRVTTLSDDEVESVTIGKNSLYDEDKGDACYARLLGTYEEGGCRIGKCNVTKNCVDMMTSKGTSRYVTTHQLLYFIVMETVKCREKVEEFLGDKGVASFQKDLCTNIYKEALEATSGGKVMESEKDLFLERVLLCGTLGYEDFLKEDWIKMTLQWPDSRTGCFKPRYHSSIFTGRSERSNMRKLLREKTMKDGCLSHTSGLGFGTFCLYLHHLTMNI
ncbi:UPF0764 protein C16orf89 homolog [Mizuhopecten yessoensis]|uniref:UPF0764 protein C16orf89-like n=1 Tax=Mizuhopecten yessoensis TaxID=6573 RepID=A0A210PUY5_MIZYE|nr:UPF0764 protein C16orf89 homolog [Mizuhopecten yessoensis]OWF40274.1 UPF0764 protein C16orf89-like [Mizuhopecten yessoensis]